MRWIGQHIYDFVSRFGNDVYIDNGSASINSKIFGAAALLDITSASDQNGPIVTIKNTKEGNASGTLQFLKYRPSSVGSAGDDIGTINFISEDDDGGSLTYVSILGEISDPTDGSPEGKISILVRHHSIFGNVITGEGNGDGVVDVSLALGASSTTTIAGDLSVTTGLILDSVDITTVQTSAESFADNDTSLMTSAAIDDRIVAATSSTFVDLTSEVSGTLPVANGGTGATSLTDNKLLTGTGTSAITAEANATYDGTDFTLTSATSTKPILSIENTTEDANAGELRLIGRRSTDASIVAGNGDDTGTISFVGENAKTGPDPETITYSKIVGENSAATDGAEMGKMSMSVGHNGSAIGGSLGFQDFLSSTASLLGETTTYGSASLMSTTSFDTTLTNFQSAVSTGPMMSIRNHTNDATGGSITFINSRGGIASNTANQNGDDLGSMVWSGFDSGVGVTTFAKILGEAESITHTDEAGKLSLTVATSDGSTSALQQALTATGHATDNEVDIGLGYGAASTTTIAGGLADGTLFHGRLELGHASDTTFSRVSAGVADIQGKQIFTTATPALTSAAAGVPAVTMQTRRTITTAEANSMHTTPIELVPAQGANTVIIPLGGMVRIDRAATQSASACDWNMHYADQEPGAYGTASIQHFRRFMYGETGDRVYHITPGLATPEVSQNLTNDVNKAVEVSFDSAATTDCFTSIEVYLTYQVFNIA
jgi:hypothetical protein